MRKVTTTIYHNQMSAIFCGACASFSLTSDDLSLWSLLIMVFVVFLFTAISCLVYEGLNFSRWIKDILLLLICCGWRPLSGMVNMCSSPLPWEWLNVWELVSESVMHFCWPAVGAIVAWRFGARIRGFSLLCVIAGLLLLWYGLSPAPGEIDWDRMG